MSPVWHRIDKAGRAGVSERETSKGARKLLGNFSKFYEPLEKIRARFLEEKFLQEWRTGPQPGERTFLEAAPTCDFPAREEVYACQLHAISQRLDVACVELD